MVRLGAIAEALNEGWVPDVSIPVWCDWERKRPDRSDGPVGKFQFQYGAIGRNYRIPSIWIRYKFQFQYGAIGSDSGVEFLEEKGVSIPVWCDWELAEYSYNKDVEMVSIPVWCDWERSSDARLQRPEFCFNSSMVRLGAGSRPYRRSCAPEFQFQYGAIGRSLQAGSPAKLFEFQFQYGAIGRKKARKKAICLFVSIPVWCDWEHNPGV